MFVYSIVYSKERSVVYGKEYIVEEADRVQCTVKYGVQFIVL